LRFGDFGGHGSIKAEQFGAFDDEEWGDVLREMGISGKRYQDYLHQAAHQAEAGLEVHQLIRKFLLSSSGLPVIQA